MSFKINRKQLLNALEGMMKIMPSATELHFLVDNEIRIVIEGEVHIDYFLGYNKGDEFRIVFDLKPFVFLLRNTNTDEIIIDEKLAKIGDNEIFRVERSEYNSFKFADTDYKDLNGIEFQDRLSTVTKFTGKKSDSDFRYIAVHDSKIMGTNSSMLGAFPFESPFSFAFTADIAPILLKHVKSAEHLKIAILENIICIMNGARRFIFGKSNRHTLVEEVKEMIENKFNNAKLFLSLPREELIEFLKDAKKMKIEKLIFESTGDECVIKAGEYVFGKFETKDINFVKYTRVDTLLTCISYDKKDISNVDIFRNEMFAKIGDENADVFFTLPTLR